MKFIRKTSILVKTSRRFVIRGLLTDEPPECGECAEQMLAPQSAADYFGVSRRVIYRLIERKEIHFAETDVNEIYVCPASVEAALKLIGERRTQ